MSATWKLIVVMYMPLAPLPKGSFTCACNRGFHGTGYKCVGKLKVTTELCYSEGKNVIVSDF